MVLSPVITWTTSTTPFPALTSLAFTGAGPGGAIPMGTTSGSQTVRLYNNFAAASSIADATGCVLAIYDDAVHQGIATGVPSLSFFAQVQVLNYNGGITGADALFYPIGGITKHPVPTNGGTISGTGANYVTVSLQIVIPASASVQGLLSQGIWLEYNSIA